MSIDTNYQTNWEKYQNNASEVYQHEGNRQGALFQYALCVYQVCNGGFVQYFGNGYNGYASKDGNGSLNRDAHKLMVSTLATEFSELKGNQKFDEMIKILDDFSSIYVNEDRYHEVENEYYGLLDSYDASNIDARFYAIYEEFGELLDQHI